LGTSGFNGSFRRAENARRRRRRPEAGKKRLKENEK